MNVDFSLIQYTLTTLYPPSSSPSYPTSSLTEITLHFPSESSKPQRQHPNRKKKYDKVRESKGPQIEAGQGNLKEGKEYEEQVKDSIPVHTDKSREL